MFLPAVLLLSLASAALAQQECRMRLDEADIDLHGWLRAFYSCPSLGRSFVMDHSVQRPLPSYAGFSYGRKDYHLILKEVLGPLGLKLVQGKWVDAVVAVPPVPDSPPPALPPSPLGGELGASGGGPDSLSPVAPQSFAPSVSAPRRFRAMASGLLRSSARSLGFGYSELLASASRDGVSQLWNISALASDSLGSLDFARIVRFSASGDSARVIFGSESRRAESTISYENGSALTQYSSLFDGLTVTLSGDRWSFVWRGSGSLLDVPGVVGQCASGSSKVSFDSAVGIPFLSAIPVLRYLFSHVRKHDDDLLVVVCVDIVGEEGV